MYLIKTLRLRGFAIRVLPSNSATRFFLKIDEVFSSFSEFKQ